AQCRAARCRRAQARLGLLSRCYCSVTSSPGARRVRLRRVRWRTVDPTAPLFVVVTHAVLVVDRLVFLTTMENATGLRLWSHRSALTNNTNKVFVQVTTE